MWTVACVWEGDKKASQIFLYLQETCEHELEHVTVDIYEEKY